MIISKCCTCQHEHICKYKDEYDKVIRDINVKVPEPFNLTLVCSHYYNTQCYLGSTSSLQDWSSVTTNCSSDNTDELSRCPAGGDNFVY